MLYDVEQIFNAEADAVVEAKNIGHACRTGAAGAQTSLRELHPGRAGAGSGRHARHLRLAAGYTGDVPFIVDLDPNGLIGHHEEIGFQAVGSGAPMAQQAHALLAHFRMTERDVDYGVVAALACARRA